MPTKVKKINHAQRVFYYQRNSIARSKTSNFLEELDVVIIMQTTA